MKIVSILAVIVSLITFNSYGDEEDPTKAYIDFWGGFMYDENDTVIEFTDGTSFEFYGGRFITVRTEISSALLTFKSMYNVIYAEMTTKMKVAQANFNMGKWTDYMTGELYAGIARQQEIDAERIEKAQGSGEDAAAAVAELTMSTSKHVQDLKGSLDGQLAQVSQSNSQLINQMATAQNQKNIELENKIKELQENKGSDPSVVNSLQAEVNKIATEISTINESISKLKEANEEIDAKFYGISEMLLNIGTYTNEMKRISKWLGHDDDLDMNPGIFMRPKMIDGGTYSEDSSITNFLSDRGIVSYSSIMLQQLGFVSTKNGFIEIVGGDGKTNVVATFGAPLSWAGPGVICTNQVYEIKEPITWVTNITENIDARTSITNIFNEFDNRTFITNLVVNNDNRQFVTNIVFNNDNRSFVTNIVMNYKSSITNYYSIIGLSKDGSESAPSIPAEDDPYSGEYESEEKKDALLPVKNALNIVAITNSPWSMIESECAFDEFSIWTNGNGLVEIAGFHNDGMDDFLTYGDNYFPVRRTGGLGEGNDPVIVWYQFPWFVTNITSITTNDLDYIRDWIKKFETIYKNNIFNVVITNAEKFADMKTNLWGYVDVDTLLDNASVWTNGEKKIEIKGFEQAEEGKVPVVSYDDNEKKVVDWDWNYIPDGQYGWSEVFYSSLEKVGTLTNVVQIAGFQNASEGAVPYKVQKEDGRGDGEYSVEWTYVPSGVTAQSKKVLTYDGTSVAWGDYRERTGCFELVNGHTTNTYYRVGGRTYQAPSYALVTNCINCLVITMSGSTPIASYATYGSLSALQSAEADTTKYIMPLYTTDASGAITCDWRVVPNAAMGEFAQ